MTIHARAEQWLKDAPHAPTCRKRQEGCDYVMFLPCDCGRDDLLAEIARQPVPQPSGDERRFPIQGGPSIPWACIAPHEAQAQRNHDQTLERLAQRGGLSPCEAVAVLEGRKWQRMDEAESRRRLLELTTPQPSGDYTALIQDIVRRARLFSKVGPAGSGIQMHQLMQVEIRFSMTEEQVVRELLATPQEKETTTSSAPVKSSDSPD